MANKESLITRIASRFGVDSGKFFETLKATAFKQKDGSAPSNEQMMALLIVAEQYGLNPFTREIYAFPDKYDGIIPVVGVDGWARITNDHPAYDGIEFEYSDKITKMPGAKVECPEWIECSVYRKDRSRPIRVREYLDEVYRAPFQGNGRNGSYTVDGPWQTHTKRQLRHKSLIQACRITFGFTGIYDTDEAERIRDLSDTPAIVPAVQHQVSQVINHQKIDPVLEKLVSRAVMQNAWAAAHQYAESRFSGSELDYAKEYLQEKELGSLDVPKQLEHEVKETQVQEAEVTETVAAEQEPPMAQADEAFELLSGDQIGDILY